MPFTSDSVALRIMVKNYNVTVIMSTEKNLPDYASEGCGRLRRSGSITRFTGSRTNSFTALNITK
jgi:hypothetical protein